MGMSCTNGFTCGNMITRPQGAAEFTRLGAAGATGGVQCQSWNDGALYGLGVQAPAYGTVEAPVTGSIGHAGVTYGFMSVNAFDQQHDVAISATAANDLTAPNAAYAEVHRLVTGSPADNIVV